MRRTRVSSEDSDSDSDEPVKSVGTITRSFENFTIDGARNFADVLNELVKQKPDTAETTLRVVKKIKPDLCSMSRNFKQAFDHIERETKALQKLTEKKIHDAENMKMRKEELQKKIKLDEDELTANKSNLKDLEKNISFLNEQISGAEKQRVDANRKAVEERESAETKSAWALGLLFVPGVNVIASPILAAAASSSEKVAGVWEEQGRKLAAQKNTLEEKMTKVSEAIEDMSKKVESNKRAIVSSNRKQEKLQRKLTEMQKRQRDLNSKKKLVEEITTQAGINNGSARTMEGACSRSLSLGQMLDPMKELMRDLSQTNGVARKLEELTSEKKLTELEVIWKKVAEEKEALEFQDTADWI